MYVVGPGLRVAFLLLLAFSGLSVAEQQTIGKVVSISDGDTLTVLTPEKRQIKVRLSEIDTPERRQPYGTRARQTLADLVFQRRVRVDVVDVDRYGRTVGRVYRETDGLDINAEMVRIGAAWVYRQYNDDQSLLTLEQGARDARRGLWALSEAQRTPPWDWRRQQRRGSHPSSGQKNLSGVSFSCGSKRYCREMRSCEEAKLYLSSCGLSGLDGDGDGLPCESLCKQ